MTLVRVGNLVMNLDHVRCLRIDEASEVVQVTFSERHALEFRGETAQALVVAIAVHLPPAVPTPDV